MTGFEDLDVLEREVGPSLRVALRRAAAKINEEHRQEVPSTSASTLRAPVAGLDGRLLDVVDDVDAFEDEAADERLAYTRPTVAERTGPRWWLVVAAAAAVVLLIGGTVLVAETEDEGIRTVDEVPGSTSTLPPSTVQRNQVPTTLSFATTAEFLPPEGAATSTPETGELVASVTAIPGGLYHVYADGRVIWLRAMPIALPEGPVHPGATWVERRLTPEALERVRSEFLATGLFDVGQPTTEVAPSDRDPSCLCVRVDGRLLAAAPSESGNDNSHLIGYLEALDTPLHSDDWVDPEAKPYIPSNYRYFIGERVSAHTVDREPDQSAVLETLPGRVAQLLGGRGRTRDLFGEAALSFDVTTAEAHLLAKEFDEALQHGARITEGWGLSGQINGFGAVYTAPEPGAMILDIQLWPLLPDGVPGFS